MPLLRNAMPEKLRALIVDDEESYRHFFKRSLERREFQVATAASPDEADGILETQVFDVVVLDILMPGETGVGLLKRIKRKEPFAEIILISGHATVEAAIEALRAGATDFIEKPFKDSEQVLASIERAAQRRRAKTGPWDILLIANDNKLVPNVVSSLKPHGVVVVDNGADALRFLSNRLFHIVLLNLDRADASALDCLNEIVSRHTGLPVVVITTSGDDEMAVKAIEMGAENFVKRESVKEDLASCIVEVLDPNRALLTSMRPGDMDALMGPAGALRFMSSGESFYRLLINSMAEACFVMDTKGTVTFTNEALERLCGIHKDKILGWKGHELFSEDSQKKLQKIFEGLTVGSEPRTFGAEVELRTAAGQTLPVLLRGTTLHTDSGEYEASYIIMTDIHEQKERERRLEELLRMQTDFISMTSHELNTPIAVIAGSLSLLTERVFGELNEQQAKHLSIAERNVARLQRLVRDLLDISRIDSGRLNLQLTVTDLRGPIMSACQSLFTIAQERSIHLTYPGADTKPVKAAIDADRIEQVVLNLVNNALRFAASAVTVKIGEAGSGDGSDVRIVVEDDGPGISDTDRENLFKKFFRGQKSAQAGRGTGLGLAIVKGIVAAHGGTIHVQNRPEGGSCFTVLLPAREYHKS